MVTESGGEISCSVEETNRIRALLGLRVSQTHKHTHTRTHVHTYTHMHKTQPLDMEKKESAAEIAVRNMAEKKAEEQRLRELAELEVS